MQRGSAILIVLFILLIISTVASVFIYKGYKPQIPSALQTTKTKPSLGDSIKTYTNQTLGFELKFNKNLMVREDSEQQFNKRGGGDFRKNFKDFVGYEPGKVLGAVTVLEQDESFDKSPFTVWIYDNPNNTDTQDWYNKYWYFPFVWGDFDYSKEKIKPGENVFIDGEIGKGVQIDYQPVKPKLIYLNKGGKMYLFRILGQEGQSILDSFKLLNSK